MRYLLLLYDNEQEGEKAAEAEFPQWMEYSQKIQESGKLLGGEALNGVDTATTVTKASGKLVASDGPFAETKEQLGGFFMIEAKDLDEAIQWAEKMPHIHRGKVEIRPIMEMDV